MDLQTIFNRIVFEGETVVLLHRDRADYESTVVMLRRKWRHHVELMKGFDDEHICTKQYMKCTYDREKVTGTYCVADISLRVTSKKDYRILL